ncbi:MAG: hypothetical protein GX327_08295 [Epulopiscium sp.]|nr:hypothetical protein [Candidatus Epulonipiscium sp.]
MNKQLFFKGCIIIVFIICGILYINNQFDSRHTSNNQAIFLEEDILEDDDYFVESFDNKIEALDNNENDGEVIKEDNNDVEDIIEEEIENIFYVYICGAVKKPGVYSLKEGSRIIDVLDMAGGALEDADLNLLNLAEKIFDEQKIYIPKIGEEIDKSQIKVENRDDGELKVHTANNSVKNSTNNLININTASLDQLQSLPGIGAVIAQNIIDYRNSQGPFRSIEEIKNVSRIGDKTFEKIKDKITVN